MAANEEQRRRMLAMLLRIPPKNALQQQPAQQPSNWLSKPLPMEGRFGLLPIKEEVPGMGPSLFNKRELALPGLLAGAVNAFTAPGRSAQGLLADPKEEAVNFAGTFMGGGLLGSRIAPAPVGSIGMNAGTRAATKEFADSATGALSQKFKDVRFYISGKGNDTVRLDDLVVPPEKRGGGVGTDFMNDLTRMADERGVRLVLDPALPNDRYGTTSKARLVDFYKRFGFVQNRGRNTDHSVSEGMIREPKK
jgi:GNAT superfamily N-acetyltransferase